MSKPRIACITQARMASTRLPGKVLLPILGRPMLAWHLGRLKRCALADVLAVATVDAPDSRPIAELAASLGLPVTFGSENDVLARFHACAAAQQADVVVRVTSDCPLIDPALVDAAIRRFLDGGFDYLHVDVTQYPRGFDAEVCSRAALDAALAEASDGLEREHVTPFVYRRPQRFRLGSLGGGRGGQYRLCVDQQEDLDLVRRVCESLQDDPAFGWREVVDLLDAHPQWTAINRAVIQKAH
jgi:Spore coat polysaccharide biosynthesis protein F, CMP-KDO synthetase homolog